MDNGDKALQTGRMYFSCMQMRERAAEYGLLLPEPWAPGPRHDRGMSIVDIYDEMVEQYNDMYEALRNAKNKWEASR